MHLSSMFSCLCFFSLIQWSSDDDLVSTPPTLSDPMNGTTSPLGLRLRKSPSLLDLIQMRLSKEEETNKEDSNKGTLDAKLKASNFPASILRIGTWEVNDYDCL